VPVNGQLGEDHEGEGVVLEAAGLVDTPEGEALETMNKKSLADGYPRGKGSQNRSREEQTEGVRGRRKKKKRG